jgi:acetyltransferase-like isoleucine patch superfamily enzyme
MIRKSPQPPKILDLVMSYFPFTFGVLVIILMLQIHLFVGILTLYLIPPLLYRLMIKFWPMPLGVSYLGKKNQHGNMWFFSYQLQLIFTTFSFLEKILILIPGAYSFWLRLWGAKIGQKINWTPECKIVDRPLINIGDRVLVGNRSYLSSHVIKKKEGKYLLWISPIEIGEDTVLAFSSVLSPGVKIGKNCFIKAGAGLYPNTIVKDGENYERN